MSYNLTRRVEDDIVALARRCGLKRVILFGSRARGDNRERSDIDLAIRGGNTADFIASVDDEIYTLLMFDIVDLEKPVQAELLTEINRDGVIIYEKIENFCKALNNLQIIRDTGEPYDILTMTGGVALFEICFEQAWKTMKDILADQGYSAAQTGSPRQILKLAYSAGMVQDEEKWLAMLASRNEVSHSYNEEIALGLVRAIKADYIRVFEELKAELGEKWL